MKQAAILTGVILIGIGLFGYFGLWMEQNEPNQVDSGSLDSNVDHGNSNEGTGKTSDESSPGGDPNGDRDGSTLGNKKKSPSLTALIPAGFGTVILFCGLVAFKEKFRKHAMHGAAGIALLGGLAGLGRGIPGLIKILGDDPDVNRRSVVFVWLMAIVCFGFVFVAVNSFVAARKASEKLSK